MQKQSVTNLGFEVRWVRRLEMQKWKVVYSFPIVSLDIIMLLGTCCYPQGEAQ